MCKCYAFHFKHSAVFDMLDMTPTALTSVTVVLRERPNVAGLAHVHNAISIFFDGSVEIPLARACKVGSLALLGRIWESSDPALHHSSRWSLCKFRRTDRHYYKAQFAESIAVAAKLGDLDAVRWLFQHFRGCAAPPNLVETVASAGHLRILQFLLEYGRHAQIYRSEAVESIDGNDYASNAIVWGGKDIEAAAKAGHGEIVRWLYEQVRGVERDFSRVMVYTVRQGDLPLVQWILANVYRDMPQLSPPSLIDAARGGHLHIVKWLVEQNMLENLDECVHSAAANGFFSVIVWLLERDLGRGAFRSLHLAAINGHLEITQYLHAKGMTDYGENTMYMAAERGHLKVVEWLYSEFSICPNIDLFPVGRPNTAGQPRHSTAMDAAASNGHLNVLQFLHKVEKSMESSPERRKRRRNTRERGQPRGTRAPTCTRAAMTNAAAEGHLDVVKWLHDNRGEGCSPNVINTAARNGHLEVVQWLHEHIMVGCTTAAMDGAAANGHLGIVQWLHENRTEGCTTTAMDRAAGKGHLEVVQWLHTNRVEGCTQFAMDSASRSGYLDVVQWLHRHRSEGCTDNAMDGAAYNGHFSIVQWLHSHRLEGCTIDSMHFAAVHGHFEVLLFLHSQRAEGCSRYTAVDAAARGNTHIVTWLRQHYPKYFSE